jgi:hypothetical protein
MDSGVLPRRYSAWIVRLSTYVTNREDKNQLGYNSVPLAQTFTVQKGINISPTLYSFIFLKVSKAKQATLVVSYLHEEVVDF